MKCPICGLSCTEGMVEIRGGISLIEAVTQMGTSVIWYPEKEGKRRRLKDAINLSLDAKGYYCEECMKVFAKFDRY